MNDSESELIRKMKEGNQQAFKKLYDNYAAYSLRTAYAITKNKSDASDIVQETFIRVFGHIKTYDMARPFKPWFYRILVNESRRFLERKSKAAISLESEELLDHLHRQSQDKMSHDDVGWAIDQLDGMYRIVIILKYLNGFTEKEIAAILDKNVNTIKSRLYKARQRLRMIIGGVDDE